MRKSWIAAVALMVPMMVRGQVVTFDGLPTSAHGTNTLGTGTIPAGYDGFDWSGFTVGSGSQYFDTGYLVGTVSGPNFAFPSGDTEDGSPGAVGTISSANPFVFSGGYFTAGDQEGYPIVVTGALNGVTAYTDTLSLSSAVATYYTFPTDSITQLTFTNTTIDANNIPVLDNLAFNGADGMITTTPEPSTCVLLGIGLLGLVPVVRRRSLHRTKDQ